MAKNKAAAFKEAAEYLIAGRFYEDRAGIHSSVQPLLSAQFYDMAAEVYTHARGLIEGCDLSAEILDTYDYHVRSSTAQAGFMRERAEVNTPKGRRRG